jgi:hypothetical protein
MVSQGEPAQMPTIARGTMQFEIATQQLLKVMACDDAD